LHKKKNHLNAFLKEYEGRYEYRRLTCENRGEIWSFLDKWREEKGEVVEDHLDYEVEGIHAILNHCCQLHVRMSGVYIDGKLQAFTIGSYNPFEKMAVIHIEKANAQAKKNMSRVNLKGTSIPHGVVGVFGRGSVLMMPAETGTGVIAGGPVRAVIEAAGVKDIRTKSHGTNNPINCVKAAVAGLVALKSPEEVAAARGKSVEEILG